ncbi:MAG: DnaA/Hda family protein [Myxococcota bacterium]|nr:DnaA/Hda family protein [Myxococcota bacterium]
MTFTPEVWEGVLRHLKNEVPEFAYKAWLEPVRPNPVEDKTGEPLGLLCPSQFHCERIRKDYLPRIKTFLRTEMGGDVEVHLRVATDRIEAGSQGVTPLTHTAPGWVGSVDGPRAEGSLGKSTHSHANQATQTEAFPEESQDFDSFVVGSCNALAREVAWALAHGQQRGLSQVYLRAESGMGKTHLAKAVVGQANALAETPATYVSAEGFTNQFLSSLRNKRTHEFMRRYRGGKRLLVIEDVQFLEGKSATQLEFFHTVQHVLDAGGKLMLTGDRMPQEMHQLSERLRSQLGSGFVAELEPPDAKVRRAILRNKASHGGVALPADCLDALVDSIRGSVRDLEGALIQLVTSASLMKSKIDLALTQAVIRQRSGTEKRGRTLSPGDVVAAVARFFGVPANRIAGPSRKREVLVPRQVAMYLCTRYTDAGIGEIGQALGRDHPAVRNAITKIERGILEKPPLRYQIEALGEKLDDLVGRSWPQG